MKWIKNFFGLLRKSKIIKFLELQFFSFLAWLIIQIISRTLKIYRINFDNVKKFKNVIYAFFHGEQFVLVFSHRHEKIVIMTSYSPDGELQTRILRMFGYDIVRGSAQKKGASSGTLAMIEKVLNGQSCAVAVDGPRGPGFKVKPGIIFLSQKTNVPIIPVRVFVEKKIVLNNWDKYIIPLPFSKVLIVYGQPFYVSEGENIKNKTLEIEAILKSIDFSSLKNKPKIF
jgi:lysophospholipid acyltransferase (LPLAT)-like uncharacterized protein